MQQRKSKKYLLDTNVFIAAFKSGWTKTTELLLELLTNPDYELISNSILVEEYRKWALRLSAEDPALRDHVATLYSLLKNKAKIVEPDKEHIEACKPYFPQNQYADLYHAATCLKANAILISNDKHYNKIKQAKLITVLNTSEAINEILY